MSFSFQKSRQNTPTQNNYSKILHQTISKVSTRQTTPITLFSLQIISKVFRHETINPICNISKVPKKTSHSNSLFNLQVLSKTPQQTTTRTSIFCQILSKIPSRQITQILYSLSKFSPKHSQHRTNEPMVYQTFATIPTRTLHP